MILDAQNTFSKEQAVTATAASANTLDLGRGDHGPSERISLVVYAKGYTAGAATVELQTSDIANAAGVLTTPVTIASFPVSEDALKAGGMIVAARLPHGLKRYVRLNYKMSPAGADGTLTAGLVLDVQQAETLPKEA